MTAPTTATATSAASPSLRPDQWLQAATAALTGGLSPTSLGLAWADWAWHLAGSPGRQIELIALAAHLAQEALHVQANPPDGVGPADDDPRFRDEAWATWPFNQLRTGFRCAEAFWREASQVHGMTEHHTNMTRFMAQQWLAMVAPANGLATNPVVLQDAMQSQGAHLLKGTLHWLCDVAGLPSAEEVARAQQFQVGRNVAITPGAVVYRNHLIELIRYDPQTQTVHPEPVLMIPSWIMKYYILDLSPHNSMARYLVSQGHTVYMLSWRNPDASDRDLSMDDYLRLGVLDALRAIDAQSTGSHGVHAMGYCLGGTLLALAGAALSRPSGISGYADLPALKSITLLAAQTDFSEPGELGLFIDESQVDFVHSMTQAKGYFSGKQMAGYFQFLHSRDLVWTRRMREYLMGEREPPSDLLAWNADTTRMPARMHHEYLTSLYLRNALASGAYLVDGHAASLAQLQMPLFVVGTQRDHISPWTSVYKLHHLCDAEITFVLTTGGHNAGIISEPGHPKRSYQMTTRATNGAWVESTQWSAQAPHFEGSWWPAWQQWLAAHSGRKVSAHATTPAQRLGAAPGEYVLQRYTD